MTAYYNEFDPFAAAWLRELIAAGHIAPGDVDERSIEDVSPDDLQPYTQCHFFAGIGVWSYALRGAGWRDDEPVWTGSCPCQPFSAAGKGGGFDDERHLWPAFFHLIQQCDPAIVIGEQVASKDGLAWLDLVRADVEGTGRAFAAADLCAAGVGAPHIRQRSFWMADADGRDAGAEWQQRQQPQDSETVDVEHPGRARSEAGLSEPTQRQVRDAGVADDAGGQLLGTRQRSEVGGLDDSQRHGRRAGGDDHAEDDGQQPDAAGDIGRPGPTNGFWRDADWLYCRDGKWRPVEPGTFPLAHGATNRVGRLRGYGNAIVAPVAQTFIEAVIEARRSAALLT